MKTSSNMIRVFVSSTFTGQNRLLLSLCVDVCLNFTATFVGSNLLVVCHHVTSARQRQFVSV